MGEPINFEDFELRDAQRALKPYQTLDHKTTIKVTD